MMHIQWRTVFTGVILAVLLNLTFLIILGFILGIFSPVPSIIAILLPSIYVGYLAGNYKNVWAYGILVGVIGEIAFWTVTFIIVLTGYGLGEPIKLIMNLITGVIFYGLIGSIGGSIGIYIKRIRTSTLTTNKNIQNHPKTFTGLLILGIVLLPLFMRISKYDQIFGYKINNILLIIAFISLTIVIVLYLKNNSSKIR